MQSLPEHVNPRLEEIFHLGAVGVWGFRTLGSADLLKQRLCWRVKFRACGLDFVLSDSWNLPAGTDRGFSLRDLGPNFKSDSEPSNLWTRDLQAQAFGINDKACQSPGTPILKPKSKTHHSYAVNLRNSKFCGKNNDWILALTWKPTYEKFS